MNIHAKCGHKVAVTEESITNGYIQDRVIAEKYLAVGNIYTVEYINV